MLELAGNGQYEPEQESSPDTGASDDNGSSSDQREEPCAQPRTECYHYQPLQNGRPVGAAALICPGDLKPKGSKRDDGATVHVPGFPEGDNIGPDGKPVYNRTHIIGDMFHGEWRTENLFAGYDRMNKSGMKLCENKIAKQLRAQNPVYYSGQLDYANDEGNVATGIRVTAYTKEGQLFDVTVKNITEWQQTC